MLLGHLTHLYISDFKYNAAAGRYKNTQKQGDRSFVSLYLLSKDKQRLENQNTWERRNDKREKNYE